MLNENSKLSLSLNKVVSIIVFIVGLSFTVGMSYQSILPDRQLQQKQAEEIQDIKITMAKVTIILEEMKKTQDQAKQDISVLHERTNKINSEVVVISSYVTEEKRLKK